jgi:hypothetical protein
MLVELRSVHFVNVVLFMRIGMVFLANSIGRCPPPEKVGTDDGHAVMHGGKGHLVVVPVLTQGKNVR